MNLQTILRCAASSEQVVYRRQKTEDRGQRTPSFPKPLSQHIQLGRVKIGNEPIIHACLGPMKEMVALARLALKIAWLSPGVGPNEEIDEMLAPAIDESC